ncbi:MAG: flagellar biosynthesis anti-sigma factor FlgM [Deltaproteobacteria bacterium RBG_19FT_COMBO_52_11]|nr:MAG: flagellar biosynthesis anti-sigma factor FlgM [Deltaproteobacteria bacterium RBG_19FT_COMBO_52_11]
MKLSDGNKKMNYIALINRANKSNPADKTRIPQKVKNQIFSLKKIKPSDQSREIKRIRALLDLLPEGRSGRVAVLKKAIAEGDYHIKAEAIADKMLKESILLMNRGFSPPRPKKLKSRS